MTSRQPEPHADPDAEPDIEEIEVCGVDEVEPGGALRVELFDVPAVAVFNVDGGFRVIADRCSHGDASLAEGELLEDDQVECPWHSGRFCLKTGAALTFPAEVPVRAYDTRVRDGRVWIRVTSADLQACFDDPAGEGNADGASSAPAPE